MDRLNEKEYLEQVKQVLSEEEYALLLEVFNKTSLENTAMDKTDIIFNEEDFIEKMTMLLNQLFRIYDMATLPNDKRKIKFYLLNSESMDI